MSDKRRFRRRKYSDPRLAMIVTRCLARGKKVVFSLLGKMTNRDKVMLIRDLDQSGRRAWAKLVAISLPQDHPEFLNQEMSNAQLAMAGRIVLGLEPIPGY